MHLGDIKSTININYPKYSKEIWVKKNAESTVTCRNLVYLVISLLERKHSDILLHNYTEQHR